MLVAVTGSKGLLGQEVVKAFSYSGYEVLPLPHQELDITNQQQVMELFASTLPAILVNCAAYTAVDKAEEELEKANLINGLGVRNLAIACKQFNISIIHISTDYVFNGQNEKPYCIFDKREPLNAYGYSKYLGEKYLETIQPNYYLIRTSWLFGAGGPNFVASILKAAKMQPEIKVVNDQWGCPTYAVDLAAALVDLVETGAIGVYHITNQGVTSWYEFAKLIIQKAGLDTIVKPVTSEEFPRSALRPKNSVLDSFPLKETIGRLLPPWEDALQRYLKDYCF